MSGNEWSESTKSNIRRVWSNIQDEEDDENRNSRKRLKADKSDEELNEPLQINNNSREIVVKEPFKLCQDIQKLLECVVCFEICPGAPPVPTCVQGHIICRFCLERLRQTSEEIPIKCPVCRTSFGYGEAQMRYSILANNLIDLLPFLPCDICNRNIARDQFAEHKRQCQRVVANCGDQYSPTSPGTQTMYPFTITYKFEAQTTESFEGFIPLGMPQQFRFAGRDFYLQNFASRQTGTLATMVQLEGDRSHCERFGIKVLITISDESGRESTEVYNGVLQPTPITIDQQAGSAQESFIVTNWNTRTCQTIQITVKNIINLVVFP